MNIRNRINMLCLVISSMVVISCSDGSIKCTLKGEVIDRPQSCRLILLKQGESPNIHGIDIPIINGKFEYVLNCKHEEQYKLVFYEEIEQGSFSVIEFFSEHGVINFTLYSNDQYKKNIIEGGKLNKEYQDYFSKILKVQEEEDYEEDLIAKVEQYLEGNYSEVLKKHEALENDIFAKIELLSEEGFDISPIIKAMTDSANYVYNEKILHWGLQYTKEHPTIVGYSILLSNVNFIATVNRNFQQTHDILPFLKCVSNDF